MLLVSGLGWDQAGSGCTVPTLVAHHGRGLVDLPRWVGCNPWAIPIPVRRHFG